MDKRKPDGPLSEAELDALFGAATQEAQLPSADMMARILADAATEQSRQAAQRAAPAPQATPPTLFARIHDTLGGWAGLSGLAGAVATGLVIGVATPDTLSTYASAVLGGDALLTDYVPGLDGVAFDG
ncbi:MAG: dihydroorotate dehydrogenase [Pseudomonadota bacterium]